MTFFWQVYFIVYLFYNFFLYFSIALNVSMAIGFGVDWENVQYFLYKLL